MRYDYALISKDDQNLERQQDAFDREACSKAIKEAGSGVKSRHRFSALLGRMVAGNKRVMNDLRRSTAEPILQ